MRIPDVTSMSKINLHRKSLVWFEIIWVIKFQSHQKFVIWPVQFNTYLYNLTKPFSLKMLTNYFEMPNKSTPLVRLQHPRNLLVFNQVNHIENSVNPTGFTLFELLVIWYITFSWLQNKILLIMTHMKSSEIILVLDNTGNMLKCCFSSKKVI